MVRERADAARNRQRILDAAARIVAEDGAERLTLNEVARVAGVGVGTVYRRFETPSRLMFALLAEHDRELLAAVEHGSAPLGPGASPRARLSAYLHALVDLGSEVHALILAVKANTPPGARYQSDAYRNQHAHLVFLLRELRPDADADLLADALLAPLAPALISFQLNQRGATLEQIKANLDDVLDQIG